MEHTTATESIPAPGVNDHLRDSLGNPLDPGALAAVADLQRRTIRNLEQARNPVYGNPVWDEVPLDLIARIAASLARADCASASGFHVTAWSSIELASYHARDLPAGFASRLDQSLVGYVREGVAPNLSRGFAQLLRFSEE